MAPVRFLPMSASQRELLTRYLLDPEGTMIDRVERDVIFTRILLGRVVFEDPRDMEAVLADLLLLHPQEGDLRDLVVSARGRVPYSFLTVGQLAFTRAEGRTRAILHRQFILGGVAYCLERMGDDLPSENQQHELLGGTFTGTLAEYGDLWESAQRLDPSQWEILHRFLEDGLPMSNNLLASAQVI